MMPGGMPSMSSMGGMGGMGPGAGKFVPGNGGNRGGRMARAAQMLLRRWKNKGAQQGQAGEQGGMMSKMPPVDMSGGYRPAPGMDFVGPYAQPPMPQQQQYLNYGPMNGGMNF